jgi:hypothetical protein
MADILSILLNAPGVNEWFRFRNVDGRQVTGNHISWLAMVDARERNHVESHRGEMDGCVIEGFMTQLYYKEP